MNWKVRNWEWKKVKVKKKFSIESVERVQIVHCKETTKEQKKVVKTDQ